MYPTFNNVFFDEVKNKTDIYTDDVKYGIDWNTGLSWVHLKNKGCPVYCDSFQIEFDKYFSTC